MNEIPKVVFSKTLKEATCGLPIFGDLPKPIDLKLVSLQAFPGGTVAKTYRPA